MLFADKRFDISEQVLRVLNRSEKREQLTKKQLKEEELKENREDALDENPIVAERQKALDDKKTSREKKSTSGKWCNFETYSNCHVLWAFDFCHFNCHFRSFVF